jgi:ribonuclease R
LLRISDVAIRQPRASHPIVRLLTQHLAAACSQFVGESGELCCIADENAQDFDDAVHVEKLSNGNYRLAVHIADVAAYVAEGSAIDREARERATSVYFPDRVIPMLPERLSNEICSLRPGVDRLVQSVIMEINAKGSTVNYEFEDAVIRSAHRTTYKEIAALLEGENTELQERYADILDQIRLMSDLCDVLRQYRGRRGSIDFDLPEPELVINLRGEVEDVVRSERNMAHRIIEEFMIRANEVVASHLTWEDVPALFRVHEGPDLEKVEKFREFISGLGLHLGGGKAPQPQDFRRLVGILDG